MITFYYRGILMHNTFVNHHEGCRISPQQPLGRGALYSSDTMQTVHFPPAELIESREQRFVTHKLLGHIERGILVRANQEGIFIKRLCQSRVFWCGMGDVGQYSSVPCKLERDAVVKIFDTAKFFQGEPLVVSYFMKRNPGLSLTPYFSKILQLCSSIRRVRFLLQIQQ